MTSETLSTPTNENGSVTGAIKSEMPTPSTSSKFISEAQAKAAARMLIGTIEAGLYHSPDGYNSGKGSYEDSGAFQTLKTWAEQ